MYVICNIYEGQPRNNLDANSCERTVVNGKFTNSAFGAFLRLNIGDCTQSAPVAMVVLMKLQILLARKKQ